jgi:hypothetical protein
VISFSTRNTVILGLTQMGVIAAGVLAAGACCKWHTGFNLTPPSFTTLVADYGLVALVLPVVWTAVALRTLDWDDAGPKFLAFCSGFVVLALLLVGVWVGAVGPLVRLLSA